MKKGFTIFEALAIVGIMGVCVAIVTFTFNKINYDKALNKSADSVVSVLNEARSLSLSSKDASHYGVYIESNQITIFVGEDYSPESSSNITSPLNDRVAIRNISLNEGDSSVIFDRITGGTLNFGTFEMYLKEATTTYETIVITATGVVEKN